MHRKLHRVVLRTCVIYTFFAGAWILISDSVVMAISRDPVTIGHIQMIKGWAFVAITTAVLYTVLRAQLQRWVQQAERREKVERELALAHRLLDRSNDSVFVLALSTGQILDVNDTACRRLGYTREELRARTALDVSGMLGSTHDWARHAEQLKAAGAFIFQSIHRRKDGSSFPVEVSESLVQQDGTSYALAVVRDISEREHFQGELRRSEEMMAAAQRIACFGSWELDLGMPEINANPLRWSDETFRLFGLDPRSVEVTNELFFQMIPKEEHPLIAEAVERALRERTEYSLDHRIVLQNGETRFVHEHARVFIDERTGKPVRMVGTVHDITERMRLEEHLRQAQKMEAIGTLAGGVAHDFNNLLTVIQGHSSLLLARKPTEEEVTESVSEIAEAAERAANLTRQLLIFSRKQIVERTDLDLNEVVSNLTRMLRRIVGEDIVLETSLAAQLPLVHCDRGMLEQIIVNLAANARDAMPRGGRLTIATSASAPGEKQTQGISDAKPGLAVGIRVSDTGCGISPDLLQHIFEPFFTTKDVGKGTGLGLATTYGIVKMHDGWITVESEPQKGTTFQIHFPAATGDRVERIAEPVSATMARGTETILVVEDEPPVRALVTSLLRQWGYTVLEAPTATAALKVWNEHREQIALLLTDMVMPEGVSGRDLAEQLLAENPALAVIYSSGYSAEVAAPGLTLKEGANFLQKPYTAPHLAKTVRDRLDRG